MALGLAIASGCSGEREAADPVTLSTTPEAPPQLEAPAEPAPPPPPRSCETPRDCEPLTVICPHRDEHDEANCMRPYTQDGEHLLGVCDAVFCEADDAADCEAIAARCIGGGTATFRVYDPPDPEYRAGRCTVVCRGYPATRP